MIVEIGEHRLEMPVFASDGFDDFSEYTLILPEGLGSNESVKLSLGEGMSVMEISVK